MAIILNWHNWNIYQGQATLGNVVAVVVVGVRTDLLFLDLFRSFSLKENIDFLVSVFSFLILMI